MSQKDTHILQLNYADGFLHNITLTLAKLSVIVQLYRIFILPKFRIVMYILGAVVIGWGLSSIFAYAFICLPVDSTWEPEKPHHCAQVKTLDAAMPVPWIVTDFAILISPLPVLNGLQMSRWRKIGLSALFLTGGAWVPILTWRLYCVHSHRAAPVL